MSEVDANGLVPLQASVTSVFYSKPSPGEPEFVNEGGQVDEDTVVCLLEIMKCFRSTTAGIKGTVEKILVNNSDMVKKGDTLMLIRPDK
ncbi:MAG: biotin/lipoyl-containing protein [Motiliproteus sp.]